MFATCIINLFPRGRWKIVDLVVKKNTWYSCKFTDFIFHIPVSLFNRWWIAYQTALSFRCSNYFVGFLSESSCLLCGIGTVVKEDKEEKLEW